MLSRFLLLNLMGALILTMIGCQSTPRPAGPAQPINGDTEQLLLQAGQTGDYDRQAALRLAAAGQLVERLQFAAALDALAPLQGLPLSYARQDELARTLAAAHAGAGDFKAAQAALSLLHEWSAADFLQIAAICESLNDYRCSADGYIQASIELGMGHQDLPADVNETIWQSLSRAQSGPAMFTHRYHHAWWLLQQQIRSAGSIPAQQVAWQAWQKRYPSHPASLQPPQTLRRLDGYEAPRIALFLPLSGPVGSAGSAIRDGLIAAFLSEQNTSKPELLVYDTAEADIAQLWEQALLDGAEVTVGPLLKENAQRFRELSQFAAQPRLILNYLEPGPQPGTPAGSLFQFGIAIEDEARALANHVLLEGHEKLMVVYSNARWSQRASREYLDQWPYASTEANFSDIKNLTEAIGEAMQVAASEQRKDEIANILGQPLEFLARGRQDMDAVIAFTTQVEARALIPALKFHFASNLPVYATSQAARGDELAQLNGFNLTEMPLFASPSQAQIDLQRAFSLDANAQAEFYALGFDAYRLATWLPLLTPDSQLALPAASGYLWLDGNGKFNRDLNLSRVDGEGRLHTTQEF